MTDRKLNLGGDGVLRRWQDLTHVPKSARVKMADAASPLFAQMAMAEMMKQRAGEPTLFPADKLADELEAINPSTRGHFFIDVAIKRLDAARDDAGSPMTFSPCVLLYLIAAQTPNVACAVMWAFTIAEQTRKRGAYGIKELAEDFPTSFPTTDAMHVAWDAQKGFNLTLDNGEKCQFDNWLDRTEAWQPAAPGALSNIVFPGEVW